MRKIIKVILFASLLLLVACGEKIETNMNKDVLDFSFTTQDNETLSLDDLKGKYWIADMIFTNCTSVCLPMTNNMTKLQNMARDEGIDIQLVSFSVDPDYDTPEVLTEYAEQYGADLSNWAFLTGYDFDTIKEISIKSFMSPLMPPPEGNDQVTHGTRFYLIDPEGVAIKSYNGVESATISTIIDDLKKLEL
ncbi:SCO family protein [Virgibacillus soli]|uniref:SCO family protein n=1 Tax=Paracerasibacillus soli TaxID=480284 RepID=A0ABU5CSL9_9BACI|nr:SCO family protein [Virgibacillus soli]MDY0409368.1 SCO family protein [Virgibacillus soli]